MKLIQNMRLMIKDDIVNVITCICNRVSEWNIIQTCISKVAVMCLIDYILIRCQVIIRICM